MATSNNSSNSGAEQPPDTRTISITSNVRISRRKLSLVTITILLNVLLWGSIICLAASIYQIASDPNDTTNITPVVLTSTSAIATISYTIIHTTFSLNQSTWEHRQQRVSAAKKSSYVAVRLVVSLCVLWLLTSGWNMILVARRPVCLSKAPEIERWEYGSTCQISRVAMAFAAIALIASCVLFGLFGVVNRPFESHLFRHSYQQPIDSCPISYAARGVSFDSEKSLYRRQNPESTHRRNPSDLSNTDSDIHRPSMTIHAPSPVRSLGFNIFTSDYAPPPIPAEYKFPLDPSQLETPPPMFHPIMRPLSLTRPPRISGGVATPGFAPYSTLAENSASTWRAIHPSGSPSPLLRASSRSYSHLSSGVSLNNRYSRSSTSITRPHRLSYATPAGSSSSRSGSTGPDSRNSSSTDGKPSPNEVAYAILHRTHTSSTTRSSIRKTRTATTPISDMNTDADTTSGAQQQQQQTPKPDRERKTMEWKPSLEILHASPNQGLEKHSQLDFHNTPTTTDTPIQPSNISHRASTDFLSRFSPGASQDPDAKLELEGEIARRVSGVLVPRKPLPISKVEEEEGQGARGMSVKEAKEEMVRKMPVDLERGVVRGCAGAVEGIARL